MSAEDFLRFRRTTALLVATACSCQSLKHFTIAKRQKTEDKVDDQTTKVEVRRADGCPFWPGDIVTRDGTDRHRVIQVIDGLQIEVECVIAPKGGWIKVGDRETNLPRRYSRATLNQ